MSSSDLDSIAFAQRLRGEDTHAPNESPEVVAIRALLAERRDKYERAWSDGRWTRGSMRVDDYRDQAYCGGFWGVVFLVAFWIYAIVLTWAAGAIWVGVFVVALLSGLGLFPIAWAFVYGAAWRPYENVAKILQVSHEAPSAQDKVKMAMDDPEKLARVDLVQTIRPFVRKFIWPHVTENAVTRARMRIVQGTGAETFNKAQSDQQTRALAMNILFHVNA
jgi:hypothetical protein